MATTEAERLNEQIKGFTKEQISSLKANRVSGSLEVILCDQELARRERLEQHELALELLSEQYKVDRALLAEQHKLVLRLAMETSPLDAVLCCDRTRRRCYWSAINSLVATAPVATVKGISLGPLSPTDHRTNIG